MRRSIILIAIALLAALPAVVLGQTPQVHWGEYDYHIAVHKNGDLQFSEAQQLVVSGGTVHKGSLHFDTGSYGRVRQIEVAEDGQPYLRDASQAAGTYNGSDNGSVAQIDYYFRDPQATQHAMTISYIVAQAIQMSQGQPALQLKLFCQGTTCPTADVARVQISFDAPVDATTLRPQITGFRVEQSASGQGINLVSVAPVTGQALSVRLALPGSAIPAADLSVQPAVRPLQNGRPAGGVAVQPVAPGRLTISPVLCVLVIFFLFVVVSVMRSSAQIRRNTPYGGPVVGGPMVGGYPRRRRWGGFFPWGGYGGWGGGWGGGYNPPPPFIDPRYDPSQSSLPDSSAGSGGQSWTDSGGSGGQSWTDSGGSGGQSWTDSGGSGGQSWTDSGGSFSVSDGGGSGGDSGSFGGDNGSSFS